MTCAKSGHDFNAVLTIWIGPELLLVGNVRKQISVIDTDGYVAVRLAAISTYIQWRLYLDSLEVLIVL